MNLGDAQHALRLAKANPAEALRIADDLIARADVVAEVDITARWAAGVALYEMGMNDEAIARLHSALDRSVRAPSDSPATPRIALSLAAAEVAAGQELTARQRLGAISIDADPIVRALAASQLGLVELHAGNLLASLELLRGALPALENELDELEATARVQGNIGHCLLALGRLDESRPFHAAALESAERTGQTMIVAGSIQNLGFTEMRLGNLPTAIAHLERAHEVYREIGGRAHRNQATLYDDMAETYRVAGLTREALRYARLAAWVVRAGGNFEKSIDADFRRSMCLLDRGDLRSAEMCARQAAAGYRRAGREPMASRADLVAVRAEWEACHVPMSVLIEPVLDLAERLDDAGWHAEALSLINLAAARSIGQSDAESRRRLLEHASPVAATDDVALRLELHYQEVLRGREAGDDLSEPIHRAYTFLAERSDVLGDAELRSHIDRLVDRFRVIAIDEALRVSNAFEVLRTEESWRLLAVPSEVLRVEGVDGLIEVLRRSSSDRDAAISEQAEHALRVSAFTAAHGAASAARPTAASGFGFEGDDHTLVQFVANASHLFCVVVAPGRGAELMEVGPSEAVSAMAESVRSGFRRLLRPSSALAQSRLLDEVTVLCGELRGALFGEAILSGRVTVSPAGYLFDLPWSLLVPGHVDAISVAPVFASRPRPALSPARRSAIVCGPDLTFAGRDIEALLSSFPDAGVIEGAAATSAALRELLREVDLLHISAHGRFRSDSPRFSSLALADGAFTVFELESVAPTPSVVVLAACEAGRSQPTSGGGVSGTACTFLAAGTSAVIAPLMRVPDEELAQVCRWFYEAVDRRGPHYMLRAVHNRAPISSPRLWATAHAVQCIGAKPASFEAWFLEAPSRR